MPKTLMKGGNSKPPSTRQGKGSSPARKTAYKVANAISFDRQPGGLETAQRKQAQRTGDVARAEAIKSRQLADRSADHKIKAIGRKRKAERR